MNVQAKLRHAHMVDDKLRTIPLLRAVSKTVKQGDIVVDIGTGLGILAIAAVKAGANQVYAIDCDSAALDSAQASAVKAGAADRATFIEGLSFDVDVSPRVDVILCETVGSFAFDENILAALLDAKRRLLKRGGKIVPCVLELWGALCKKIPRLSVASDIANVKENDLLGKPSKIISVDFQKKFNNFIHVKHIFTCSEHGTVSAVAVWPRVFWGKGEITDASPLSKPTHWKQGILPIEPRAVKKNERVGIELIIKPHPDDPLTMTERLWRWL